MNKCHSHIEKVVTFKQKYTFLLYFPDLKKPINIYNTVKKK